MHVNLRKIMINLKGVENFQPFHDSENWNKFELQGISCGTKARQERPMPGFLYILPADFLSDVEYLLPYEAAKCAGIIFAVSEKEEVNLDGISMKIPLAKAVTALSPVQLSQLLSSQVIQECQSIYDDLVESNRYLFSNTLNKQDIGEMLEYFKQLIGNPVAVFDGMFHCLFSTDDIFLRMKLPRTLPRIIYTDSQYLNRHFVKQRVCFEIDGKEQEYFMVSFPISFRGKIRAYLSVPQIYQDIKELDSPKLEVTASAIMGQLKHNFALRFAEEKNIDSFFYNAIYRDNIKPEELKRQAGLLGFQMGHRLAVIAFHAACAGEIEESPESIDHAFRYSAEDKIFLSIEANIKKMKIRGLAGRLDDKIMAVCEMTLPDTDCIKEIKECCHQIREEFKQYFKESMLQAGVGSVISDITCLSESSRRAEKALSYGRMIYGEDNSFVTVYEDTFLLRLIGCIPEKKDLENLIPRGLSTLEEYDKRHNSELLHTLSVYFDCGCNMKKSAETMMIHYKTMAYRMKQIHEQCDVDFSDSNVFLQYALGIKIFCLLKSDS